jgi:hypothetical protein
MGRMGRKTIALILFHPAHPVGVGCSRALAVVPVVSGDENSGHHRSNRPDSAHTIPRRPLHRFSRRPRGKTYLRDVRRRDDKRLLRKSAQSAQSASAFGSADGTALPFRAKACDSVLGFARPGASCRRLLARQTPRNDPRSSTDRPGDDKPCPLQPIRRLSDNEWNPDERREHPDHRRFQRRGQTR